MIYKIEDYQLRELQEEKLYINRYDNSVMYNYEFHRYLKEFYFDVLNAISAKGGLVSEGYLPGNTSYYLQAIKKYHLNIDIRDYVEVCDYITYETWSKIPGNKIIYDDNGYYLSSNN